MTDHDAVTFLYLDKHEISEVYLGKHLVKIYKAFLFKYSFVMFLRQYTLPYLILSTSHY